MGVLCVLRKYRRGELEKVIMLTFYLVDLTLGDEEKLNIRNLSQIFSRTGNTAGHVNISLDKSRPTIGIDQRYLLLDLVRNGTQARLEQEHNTTQSKDKCPGFSLGYN